MPNYLLKERFNPYGFLVEMGIPKLMRWIYVYTGSAVKGVRVLKGALVPQKDRIRRIWTAARMGALRTVYRIYTIRVRHDPYRSGGSGLMAFIYCNTSLVDMVANRRASARSAS